MIHVIVKDMQDLGGHVMPVLADQPMTVLVDRLIQDPGGHAIQVPEAVNMPVLVGRHTTAPEARDTMVPADRHLAAPAVQLTLVLAVPVTTGPEVLVIPDLAEVITVRRFAPNKKSASIPRDHKREKRYMKSDVAIGATTASDG